MSNTNAIITAASRQKMVKARAGAITLPPITKMAFGNGGVDGQGDPISPSESATGLNNELLRKNIDGYTFPQPRVAGIPVRFPNWSLQARI